MAGLSLLSMCNKNKVSAQKEFRTVGYLMINRADLATVVNGIGWDRLTHLNLAFVNPDSTGVFAANAVLPEVVRMAHAHHVKVSMSVGGGSMPGWMNRLLSTGNRPAFIDAIGRVVDGYDLDGVDVDLEGNNIDGNYAAFVRELSAALVSRGKLMTAAVATWSGDGIPDEALKKYDFINIMSYDKTGPWNPSQGGPHAPYEMAVSDLAYWSGRRGVPKEKLVLGLPFYGYGFGAGNVTSTMSYGGILGTFPDAAGKDQVTLADGEILYYNGASTIRKKTMLALKEAQGVMIWELTQDARGTGSLLQHINDVITTNN